MQWEVWDIESGNLIGWRETEEDGLLLVRRSNNIAIGARTSEGAVRTVTPA